MSRSLASMLVIALTVLGLSTVLAHDGPTNDREPADSAGMDRMMDQEMMQEGVSQHQGMMQMMMHCTSMLDQMHHSDHQ